MQNIIYRYYKDIIVPFEKEVKNIENKAKKSTISKFLYHKKLNEYERLLYKHYIEFNKIIEEYNF